MSEENKAVVRRLLDEVWGAGDLDATEELIDPVEYRSHVQDAFVPRMSRWTGPNIVRVEVAAYRSAFPDLHVDVQDLVAEADAVAALWTLGGTNSGTMQIVPFGDEVDEEVAPTQRDLTAVASTVFRLTGGTISAATFHWDPLGLLEQVRLFAQGVRVLDLGGNRVSMVVPPED